jgi:hypothetical protein
MPIKKETNNEPTFGEESPNADPFLRRIQVQGKVIRKILEEIEPAGNPAEEHDPESTDGQKRCTN